MTMNIENTLKISLLFFISIMLLGCGNDNGTSAATPAATLPAETLPVATLPVETLPVATPPAAAALLIEGTWIFPCNKSFSVPQNNTHIRYARQITQTYQKNGNFTRTDKIYQQVGPATECIAANLIDIVTITGKYTLGNTENGYRKIDLNNVKVEATITTRYGTVLAENDSTFPSDYRFGYTEEHSPWAFNTPKVVTYTIAAKNLYYPGAISITPPTLSPAPPANPPSAITALDIFKVTTTDGATKLYLGNKGHLDGNSTNERPLSLDETAQNTGVIGSN